MKRMLLAALLFLPAGAQPTPNPPFTINRKVTLAEVNRGGRVELDYDLTNWPIQSMLVSCYQFSGPKGSAKVAEWKFLPGKGRERLDFKKMPTSQYFFTCQLLDTEGKPLAVNFRPVQLEYGGWSSRLRVAEETSRAALDPKAPLGPLPNQSEGESQWVFKVMPEAVVVQPGAQATLTASLNSRPVAEVLEWSLEGPGKIMVVENFICYYLADKKARSGQRATIRVYSPQHPQQLRQEIQVLVTSEPIKTSEPPKTSE